MFFLLFFIVVKGSRSGSVEIITGPDSDPGGQKTYRSYGSTTLGEGISFTVLQCCKFIEQSVLRTIYFGWSSLSFFFFALPRFFFTIFYVW
jgi:hypothetical protein